jgi:hypothetical protein
MNTNLNRGSNPKKIRSETMTAFKQTSQSWASLIESYANVPEVFKPFFAPLQNAGREMPYTVMTPSYAGYVQQAPQKLTCALDDEIYILEKEKGTYKTLCFPLNGIHLIEFNSVLLDSVLIIKGITNYGSRASTLLRFNTVSDPLYKPFIDRIRKSYLKNNGLDETETFDELHKTSFKLANYARLSLLPGEKVVQVVLQPELRKNLLRFLTPSFYRTIYPSHVYLLTDSEFILIRETNLQTRQDTYGGIWDYIPLSKIKQMTIFERGDGLSGLSVQLIHGISLDTLFEPALRSQIEQLVEKFKELSKASVPAIG